MSCVRKRGNSWNAQVRVSGWRSFTKSFNKKTDAITWSSKLEHQLRKDLVIVKSLEEKDVFTSLIKRIQDLSKDKVKKWHVLQE